MKITIPRFLKRKRNIWLIIIIIIIALIGWLIFGPKDNTGSIQTGTVEKQNLEETVLSTGQVVSGIDLNLSFQSSGVVRSISVEEGDKVSKGEVLASLNQSSALATLTSAKGALLQAQANYDKLVNGASATDLQSYQNAVTTAQVNLDNSYNNALTTLNNAYTAIYNAYANATSIQSAYFSTSDQPGIRVYESRSLINQNLVNARSVIDTANTHESIDLGILSIINYLNSTFNALQTIRSQADEGVYYSKVSSTDKTSIDTQKTAISTEVSSVNTLQNSIASYKVALKTAQDNLASKQAKPRQEDIDLARGQVLSAQGQVDAANAALSNLIITAPLSGVITRVDIKVGELATASKEVMVLQDVSNLHTEADVSEANIASLQIGQPIDYTFDALGPDQHFTGQVLSIDPASTVISGVVNYKIKGSLENIPAIKPGMTANMTILVAKREGALAVPSTAVINKNNKQYVRVITDNKKKTYQEVQVKTGLRADGGLVEIISGLSEGQEIVTYMKQ